MKPRLRPSATLLTTFSNCERRAFLDVLHKDEEVDSPAMQKGRRVHALLEELANTRIKTGEWKREDDPYVERLEAVGFFEETVPVSAEGWIRELRWQGEVLPWVGKVDLCTDKKVIDYKVTGNPNRVLSPREAKRSIQLLAYCLATGLRTAEFVYLLPSTVQRVEVSFSDKELTTAFNWFKMNSAVLRARWEALDPECENWERVFSLAPPSFFLCNEKWCRHWTRCIGKE